MLDVMKKALILHGTDGTPESNWFGWLKGRLEEQGYAVWLPQLPGAEAPSAAAYTAFLLANEDFGFDDETVLIGHSSGAVEILNLLQHLPEGSQVKAAVLVSAFRDDLGWVALRGLFVEPLDFEVIRRRCGKFVFVHSDNDPYCPLEQPKYLAVQTGGELVVLAGQGHFNLELGPQYAEFPELLTIMEEMGL